MNKFQEPGRDYIKFILKKAATAKVIEMLYGTKMKKRKKTKR